MNDEPKKFMPCQRRIKLPVLENDYDDFGGRSYSYWTEPKIPSSCTRTAIYVAETSGRAYCWQCAPRGASLRCYWTGRKIRHGELRHWPRTTDLEESIQLGKHRLKRLEAEQGRGLVLQVSGAISGVPAYIEAEIEDLKKQIRYDRRYLQALEARLKR